jgi:hypothetical protein
VQVYVTENLSVDPLARERDRPPRPHPLRLRGGRPPPLRGGRPRPLGLGAARGPHPLRDPDPRGPRSAPGIAESPPTRRPGSPRSASSWPMSRRRCARRRPPRGGRRPSRDVHARWPRSARAAERAVLAGHAGRALVLQTRSAPRKPRAA